MATTTSLETAALHEVAVDRKRLVVLVPAYNEEHKIAETIAALRTVAPQLQALGITQEIFVVDDGSTDETGRRARESGADKILRHNRNQGLGAAVRTGLRAARDAGADMLVKFDADLQHDPDDIFHMIQPLTEGRSDVVYGNRVGRIEYAMPLVRRLGNRFFSSLMRALTGWPIEDSQPGIFAVNRTFLQNFILPGSYNYTQQVLLDAFHRDLRFEQVPVRFKKRESGRSFISLKYPFIALLQILMMIVTFRPLYVFGAIGLFFLFLACSVFGIEIVLWAFGFGRRPVENVNLVLGSAIFGLNILFLGLLGQLISQRNR